ARRPAPDRRVGCPTRTAAARSGRTAQPLPRHAAWPLQDTAPERCREGPPRWLPASSRATASAWRPPSAFRATPRARPGPWCAWSTARTPTRGPPTWFDWTARAKSRRWPSTPGSLTPLREPPAASPAGYIARPLLLRNRRFRIFDLNTTYIPFRRLRKRSTPHRRNYGPFLHLLAWLCNALQYPLSSGKISPSSCCSGSCGKGRVPNGYARRAGGHRFKSCSAHLLVENL